LCIASEIEELFENCFYHQPALSTVRFESDSRLWRIRYGAFQCSSLIAIDIPSSVQQIGARCFHDCSRLSIVRFDLNSRLSVVGEDAFGYCRVLETVCIPAALETIVRPALRRCGRPHIVIIETGAMVYLGNTW
jgi:hypothetical protein